MTGYEYEAKCAKLLEAKGFTQVTVTPGSGDQGVDIIAYKGGKKYAVQCKYYEGTVGNKAIQEVYAGAGFYECTKKLVITNSTLTKPAKDLAIKLDVEVWEHVDAGFLRKNDTDFRKREATRKKREAALQEQDTKARLLEIRQWQIAYKDVLSKRKLETEKMEQEPPFPTPPQIITELERTYSITKHAKATDKSNAGSENEQMRASILYQLSASDRKMLPTEVMSTDPYLRRCDGLQISRLLAELANSGKIIRETRRGKAYYSMSNLKRKAYLSADIYEYLSNCDPEEVISLLDKEIIKN